MKILKYIMAIAIVCASLGLASHVNALTIGDSRDLGLIDPNHPASPEASEDFIDILLAQPLGSGPTIIGDNAYTRTNNDPLLGVYPAADFADELSFTGGTVDLGSGGFLYLLAKYDGPNYGSVVWYVGGLTGIQSIPLFGGQYGLSHVYVFNPGTSVPDGGATVMLLGAALGTLGMVRRFLKR